MTVENGEALRCAITASPHDDMRRLVYADWCEENGRANRAQLIRLQCEREMLPVWDSRAIEIDDQLTALGMALWDDSFSSKDIFEALVADLPDGPPREALRKVWTNSSSGNITNPCGLMRVRRGFADYFRLDDKDCTDQLERLPSLTPVTAIRLRGSVGASAATVGRLPPQLRRLEVAPWGSEADFNGLLSQPLSTLTELSLEPPYEYGEANRLDTLVSHLWPVLERDWHALSLGFPLSGRTVARFANCSGSVRQLKVTDVRGDGYHPLFSGRWVDRCERVALRQYGDGEYGPTPRGTRQLLKAIAALACLRTLDLRHFQVGVRAWSEFVRAGGAVRVEELLLSSAALGSSWLQRLAEAKKPTNLRRLVLRDCGFNDEQVRWLVQGDHPHLVVLDLAHVHSPTEGISHKGAGKLVEGALCDRLRALHLVNHSVGDAGLRAFATRAWPELRFLDVRCYAQQDAVADFLFRGRYPNLVRLQIAVRGATDRLARALGDGPPPDLPFALELWARFCDDDIPHLMRSRYLGAFERFAFVYPAFTDAGKQRLRDHFGARVRV
jgi:uncharacterized protein (TIGR02996 family)